MQSRSEFTAITSSTGTRSSHNTVRCSARTVGLTVLTVLTVVLVACGGSAAPQDTAAIDTQVAKVSGWTRLVMTPSYLIVVNVLPGEPMFTQDEIDAQHPLEGELIITGEGVGLTETSRHVEAHVYSRATGIPLHGVVVTLAVSDRTSATRAQIAPTVMMDFLIGRRDIHFGNNVSLPGNIDLSVHITVDGEEVTVDGHLD